MQIELKNVQYNARMSDETSCYSAQIWVDGKHFCDVMNRGHGGPDEHIPVKGMAGNAMHEAIRVLNTRIKKDRGTEKMYGMEIDIDLEIVCGELLNAHLAARDLKRSLGRQFLFCKPGQKGVFQIKKVAGRELEQLAAIKKKFNGITTLNEMAFDAALKVYCDEAA